MMDINPNRPDSQQTDEGPLNLSDFAQRNKITEDRVWELIEEGELAARFVNDEILIIREQASPSEPAIDWDSPPAADRAAGTLSSPPVHASPVPDEPELPLTMAANAALDVDMPIPPPRQNREAALDMDPLLLTRVDADPATSPGGAASVDEDFQDVLVFAQDAMNRTMELSRELLATKDELLRLREERIQELLTALQKNEQEIRRLHRKIEDLETLCRLTRGSDPASL